MDSEGYRSVILAHGKLDYTHKPVTCPIAALLLCSISGMRITNAPEYLTTKGLLDAATAASKAVAISQQTVSVDGSTSTAAMTGSAAKNAIANASAASAQTVSDFIQARMGMSFDIIYAQPGTAAAIHLRKPITLSLPENGPEVRHAYAKTGEDHAYSLP